jgi:hypothetical protein
VERLQPVTVERLHGWLLGLPWVIERPGMAEAPGLRWFAVDCEPLGRRRLWLLTGAFGSVDTDGFGMHVVFPTAAARRIVDAGVGAVVAALGDEHNLVSLRLETTELADRAHLERMLLLGYEASFT